LIASKDALRVHNLMEVHANHDCTEEERDIIPENRRIHPDDADMVDVLLQAGAKPTVIRPILRERASKHTTARDISNIR